MSENGTNGRRPIIDRSTLLPLGVVAAIVLGAAGLAFRVGLEWNTLGNKVATVEGEIGDHETRLKIAEARIELWRRRVESALQIQLPEPQDASLKPDPADPPSVPRDPPVVAFGGFGTPPPGQEPGG